MIVQRTGLAAANQRPTGGVFVALTLLGTVTAAAAAVLARTPHRAWRGSDLLPLSPLVRTRGPWPPAPIVGEHRSLRAARRLNRAAGTIAASVLIDSAMEHYRGAFSNKAMYTPLAVSALSLLASLHGHRVSIGAQPFGRRSPR